MPITHQSVVRSTVVLLGIGLAALLAVVLATAQLSKRAQEYLGEVTTARETLVTATTIRESLLAAESSQFGYILTGNEIYLAPYDSAKTLVRSELDRLKSLLAGRSDRKELLERLGAVIQDKLLDQDTSIKLRDAGQESDAIEQVRSNRGKAFMDEANLYLTAITLESQDRLTLGVAEQTDNASWLRWTSILSALVIVLVVSGLLFTNSRYTAEILEAQDQIRLANETLELRVRQRTDDLARARDRAELLLTEVNHRVSNSLGLVSSLVRLQARSLADPAAKSALEETNGRIQAIAQLHKSLFTTGNVGSVDVATYLGEVLSQIEDGMASEGSQVSLKRSLSPAILETTDAINLGIIVTEWVTNAFKYAYGNTGGEIRVSLAKTGDALEVMVEDDGVGRGHATDIKGTGLGTRVVSTIASLMHADIQYRDRSPGTAACLILNVNSGTASGAA